MNRRLIACVVDLPFELKPEEIARHFVLADVPI